VPVCLNNIYTQSCIFSGCCSSSVCFVCSSRQENDELKVQYQLLKASYQELEQIRDSLQENENLHHSNLTDAQKELDLSKSEVSCN